MVARVNDPGALIESRFFQGAHDFSKIIVEKRCRAEIRGNGDFARFIREMLIEELAIALLLDPGVAFEIFITNTFVERHFFRIIERVKFRWCDEGRVGANKGRKKAPWFILMFRRLRSQPTAGFFCNIAIVFRICRFTGANTLAQRFAFMAYGSRNLITNGS